MRFGDDAVACPLAEQRAGILGELMHVDDVGNRAKNVQVAQRPASLDAVFERDGEEQRRAGEHRDVHRRIDALEKAEHLVADLQMDGLG